MDDISIFTDKEKVPTEAELMEKLGETYPLWREITTYVESAYPKASREWSYPGRKFGWSFRIKDKKRVIIYLLPRDQYFKVAFMFGDKACEQILAGSFPDSLKSELMQARKYMEGRGIRIDVRGNQVPGYILSLVDIKLAKNTQ